MGLAQIKSVEDCKKGHVELENNGGLSLAQRDNLRNSSKTGKKALYLTYQGLDDDSFEKVSKAKMAKAIWEKL